VSLGDRSGTHPALPWAPQDAPGRSRLDLGLLGSIWHSWARSGTPGLDLTPLGSIWGSLARSGAPGLDLELLGSIWGPWARSGLPWAPLGSLGCRSGTPLGFPVPQGLRVSGSGVWALAHLASIWVRSGVHQVDFWSISGRSGLVLVLSLFLFRVGGISC
jgi:hypothetical protein